MRKVFEGYKIISINDIEGAKLRMKNERYMDVYRLAKRRVYMEGIRKPFEVIKRGSKYVLMSNPITFIAAKRLNYSAVPCIIRNPKYELILNKTLRELNMD